MAIEYNLNVLGACFSGAGEISIYLTKGNAPFSVNWTNPNLGIDTTLYSGMSSTRTSLSPGIYSVYITDSTLPNNEEIYLSIPISNTNCCSILDTTNTTCGNSNGSVTATTSSSFYPVFYYLKDDSQNIVYSANVNSEYAIFYSLSAGTYQIESVDGGGCTGYSETFIIEESLPLDFGFYVVNNSNCNIVSTGKIFITGQTGVGPYTYLWTNGETTDSITGLTAGFYGVTVIDSKGCSLVKTTSVEDVDEIFILSTTVTQPTCLNSNGSLNILFSGGTPPFYYSASTGDIQISYSRNYTLNNLYGGLYGVSITDAAYCKTNTISFLISYSGMSNVSVVVTNSSCFQNDGKLLVNLQGGTAPYTYTLIYPDSTTESIVSDIQNNLFSQLSNGTYTVIVQDSTGCVFSNEYDLVTENKFTIMVNSTGSTNNNNGLISVSKLSESLEPFTYVLDNDKNFLTTTLSAVTFYNVAPGQHIVSVTDSTGCKQTSNIFVNSIEPVNFYLSAKNAGSGNEGQITSFISSGTPPFTFEWSDNVLNNPQNITATGLTAGTYTLTVIDSNNSLQKRTITVPPTTKISSYTTFSMGEQPIQYNKEGKYGFSKMLNEGYIDITSGHTGCEFGSANFIAKVVVSPYNLTTTKTFFTTNSLLVSPDDNIWYDAAKEVLLSVQGVSDVIIDILTNKFTIVGDLSVPEIIEGENPISISLSCSIEYEINCVS